MLKQLLWPESQLLNGINRLAQTLDGEHAATNTSTHKLEEYAETLGIEAIPTLTHYGELQKTLGRLTPGIVAFNQAGQKNYLFIKARKGKRLSVLLPQGGNTFCDIAELAECIREDHGYEPDANTEQTLKNLGLHGDRLARAKTLMIYQQLATYPIEGLWLLRPHAKRGFKAATTHARLGHYALAFGLAHLCERVALIAGVSLLGYGITQGNWTTSLIISWLLIMLSHWALSVFGQSCQVQLDVRLGLIIKRHLQYSALRLSPQAHASKGPAQLLGQALEADSLQTNALPGVFSAANAAMDLLIGLMIALFIQQWLVSGLLIIFVLVCVYLIREFNRSYYHWAKRRKQLSHLTIEHMQGNRTRLMQSGPDRWHKAEERLLHNYWLASVTMDKFALWLQAVIPALWLISSSAILCIAIIFSLLSLVQLAALLGVILLVSQAWHGIADSSQQLARSWYSWREIHDLLKHAADEQPYKAGQHETEPNESNLSVNQVSFSYKGNKSILQSININLQQGKNYLLQGESGSGKSTLLAILAGQTNPQQGWLLCNDRDLQTLGHQYWRKKICWVPQYHDNYLFSAALLFNLLLGRAWPPRMQDVKDAQIVCEKLGLTPLLNKMPAGILQSVGEMGWQLSQGERSRVYLARALLQNADFLLLDESLGALDATTSLNILTSLQSESSGIVLCMHP